MAPQGPGERNLQLFDREGDRLADRHTDRRTDRRTVIGSVEATISKRSARLDGS